MMSYRKGGIIVLTGILLLITACATSSNTPQPRPTTVEDIAFKTLTTSQNVYNMTMESVSSMQAIGVISAEKRLEINNIAGKYRLAHIAAARALYVYKALSDATNADKLQVSISLMEKAFNDFLKFVEPILQGGAK